MTTPMPASENPVRDGLARPVVFGEALFDCFPDGRRVLGGAPFNVAWHLHGFGAAPLLVSRVGDDGPGREIVERMTGWGMETEGVQFDDRHPTGHVTVSLSGGEPAFAIEADQAYDQIQFDDQLFPRPEPVGLLYHGTLALRTESSRRTLGRLVEVVTAPILCDVNLRAPWWTPEGVAGALENATWAKLNRNELGVVAGVLAETPQDLVASAGAVADRFALDGLIVTMGAKGALGIFQGKPVSVPAGHVSGAGDTVGAGDAFSAVTIVGLLRGWDPVLTLGRASAFAGAICSIRGATTDEDSVYDTHMSAWGEDVR